MPTMVQPVAGTARRVPTWMSAAAAVLLLVVGFGLMSTEDTARTVVEQTGIVEVAEAGVDYVSVGGLTKSVTPLDLSMRMETI